MRERSDRRVYHNAPKIQNFLELSRCLVRLAL